MVMLIANPLVILVSPLARMNDTVVYKVIWLLHQGLERILADRVVVANAWLAIATGDI